MSLVIKYPCMTKHQNQMSEFVFMWPARVKAVIIRWQHRWPSNSWFQLNISLYAHTHTPSSQDWPSDNSCKKNDSCLKNCKSCYKFVSDFLWISIQFWFLPCSVFTWCHFFHPNISVLTILPVRVCTCCMHVYAFLCETYDSWFLPKDFTIRTFVKNTHNTYTLSLTLSHTLQAKSQRKKEESKKQLNPGALLKQVL